LQTLLDARAVTCDAGLPLRVVSQAAPGPHAVCFEERYEVRTWQRGELQVREHNWHDLFNVLSWLTYPRTKAALNARHYAAALSQRDGCAVNRSPLQDALTLFDEGGMIVASSDQELLCDLRNFAWRHLFVARRACTIRHMHWLVLGHALAEKLLAPYIGVTGHSLLLAVDDDFHGLPEGERIERLDARAAAVIADGAAFAGVRDLAPVPVLGVPGAWPASGEASFYDNARYFRPRRAK
jgi:hypothetical protein